MKTDSPAWAFPRQMQPRRDTLGFDLDAALGAMVKIDARIPEEAYTAGILGTERQGYGCVIGDDGLVLTIGYLITEAQTIWLTSHQGHTVPGHVLAIDFASGFGLVLPALPLRAAPLPRGPSRNVGVGDELVVLGHGGIDHALATKLVAREVFSGYWEYVLDDALFTSPAHPQWGGTGVLDANGHLVGIGSLMMQQLVEGEGARVNMSVPVDLLDPVLDDLLQHGRAQRPARPWLGYFVQETEGQLVVAGTTTRGPAARAGIEPGDVIEAVAGKRVASLAELFRSVWAQGAAGATIALTLQREGEARDVNVESIDRESILWRPQGMN